MTRILTPVLTSLTFYLAVGAFTRPVPFNDLDFLFRGKLKGLAAAARNGGIPREAV